MYPSVPDFMLGDILRMSPENLGGLVVPYRVRGTRVSADLYKESPTISYSCHSQGLGFTPWNLRCQDVTRYPQGTTSCPMQLPFLIKNENSIQILITVLLKAYVGPIPCFYITHSSPNPRAIIHANKDSNNDVLVPILVSYIYIIRLGLLYLL